MAQSVRRTQQIDAGRPLFSCSVLDKISGKTLYLNVKSSPSIQPPKYDFTENELIHEWCNPSNSNDKCLIPFQTSPIFWSVERAPNGERHYAVDALISEQLAAKCQKSKIIEHYVTMVCMSELMDTINLNANPCNKLGHKVDLDAMNYTRLTDRTETPKTLELVKTSVTVVDQQSQNVNGNKSFSVTTSGSQTADDDGANKPYELLYRPKSMILTCVVRTDTLPNSIAFNEDRLVVEMDGQPPLVDTYLPFFIDLKQPFTYKFDDSRCLLRIVFRVSEVPNALTQ